MVIYHGTEGTIQIGSTEIGLIQEFTIDINNNIDPVKVMGMRKADQLVEGQQDATGTLNKAWINAELMNYATASGNISGRLPTFNLFLQPSYGASGIPTSGIPYLKAYNCKINTISIKAPKDDIHMEDAEFMAEYVDHFYPES